MRQFLTSLIIILSLSGFAQQKPDLLIFSGSDWCLPCIRLEKEIFSQEGFRNFSSSYFNEIIRADFPQKSVLSKEQQKYNDSLAEKYNPSGYFPLVLVINQKGEVLQKINTSINTVEEFIKQLPQQQREYSRKAMLMGCSFEFTLVCENENVANSLLDQCVAEVKRIEGLISEWDTQSPISELNRQAGISAVQLPQEAYALIQRSKTLSTMTRGAFDISFQGLQLYKFDQKNHMQLPDSNAVWSALKRVDYEHILLKDNSYVLLKDTGMAIGFGACGKGYAADVLRSMMKAEGISGGVINASGDLTTWGVKADGSPWKVGIANPEQSDEILYWLDLPEGAVATSGSYEKFFYHKGKRYSHIINPRSGWPVTDKKSVSVFSKSAELSDAMATALFVLPIDEGMQIIEEMPGLSAIIIDADNKVYHSRKINVFE